MVDAVVTFLLNSWLAYGVTAKPSQKKKRKKASFLLETFSDSPLNSFLFYLLVHNLPVLHMQVAVAHTGQFFVVGNDEEGLVKLFAEFEKKLV